MRAREIALAVVAFETIDVDLGGIGGLGERTEAIGRALAGVAREDVEVAVRLLIRGAGTLAAEAGVALQVAEQVAEEIDGVHVEAVRLVRNQEGPAPGVVAELARLMREDADTTGFHDEALAFLDDWRATLPGEVAEALDSADLEALIAEGLDAVIQRLAIEAGQA
jgi:hypothetical protein